MSNMVLDASAVLALLNTERGSEMVAQAIAAGAVMSTVNLSEVVAKLCNAGMNEDEVREAIHLLGIQFSDFDVELAYQAGFLRTPTRSARLSLGDRACLALAKQLNLPALTTDRVWATLALDIDVRLARASESADNSTTSTG